MNIVEKYPATIDNPNGFSVDRLPFENYMSYSRIKEFRRSAAHYKRRYKDGILPEDTDEKRLGRIMHKALLETSLFKKYYTHPPTKDDVTDILDTVEDLKNECQNVELKPWPKAKKIDYINLLVKYKKSYRKRIWSCVQEDWKTSLNDNSIIVTKNEGEKIIRMIQALEYHKDGPKLLSNGYPELWAYWFDKEFGVQWVCKLDYIRIQERDSQKDIVWITDLKTTKDASFYGFAREIAQFKYHIQMFIYHRVVSGIMGDNFQYNLTYLAVEKTDPIGVTTPSPSQKSLEDARWETERAINGIRQCEELNEWPKYKRGRQPVGLPSYEIYKLEAEAEMEDS